MQARDALRTDRRIQWLLFLLLVLCYAYFLPRWADPNQNSRLDMVMAVVEQGTFQIDAYVENTVDYALIDGHYYSDKAPGAAFVGIPVYALLKEFLDMPSMSRLMQRVEGNQALQATLRDGGTGLLESKLRFAIAQVALAFAAAAVPTAVLGLLLYRMLARFKFPHWLRILMIISYGLLTPAFAYGGAFYGHQLSAACLFGAFYLLAMNESSYSVPRLLGVGFLLGYSVITEYPSALLTGAMMVYAWFKLAHRRRILWIILSGGVVGLGFLAFNTVVYGSPFTLPYLHSPLWDDVHRVGFMSLTWPKLDVAFKLLFGPFRGLFFLSPLLLFSLPGFFIWFRSQEKRMEWALAMGCVLLILAFNASSAMWWGGFAIGPRYLLPGLPFLILPLAYAISTWRSHPWARLFFMLTAAWSWLAIWGLTLAGQGFPSDTIRNPLFAYALPRWLEGDIARNLGMFIGLSGLSSLLPLIAFLIAMVMLLGKSSLRLDPSGLSSELAVQVVSEQ